MTKALHSDDYGRFTKRLKEARNQAKLTQIQVAEKLGLPQSYVSKVERGERRIDAVELGRLARIYRKSIDFFLN